MARKDFGRLDYYDVWFPQLAPSASTLKTGLTAHTERDWATFARKYRAEMRAPAAAQALDLLAELSHHADFSVGCYCQSESRCHRSLLRELLVARGARLE